MKVKLSTKALISIISVVLIVGGIFLAVVVSTWAGGAPTEEANAARIYPAFLNPVLKLFSPQLSFPVYLNPVLKNNPPVVLTETPTPTSTATATATPTSTATATATATIDPYPYPFP